MKFAIIAGVLCAVFFFYFRTESSRSSKSAAAQAAKSAKSAKPAAKARTYYSTGLAGKLRGIGNTFSTPELLELEKSLLRRGITKPYAAKVKKVLDKHVAELNKVRNLAFSRDIGVKPGQDLDYIHPFRTSLSWLLLSAEYQCKYGKKQLGANDIATAARILGVYSSGSTGLIHFHSAAEVHKRITDTIQRVPLSKAEKSRCLAQLPDKKTFAKLLKQTLECEKKPLFSLREAVTATNPDVSKLDGYSFGFRQTLREISEERLKDVYDLYCDKLQKDFENGTISSSSGSKVGNKREDALMFEYLPLHKALVSFSKHL